MENNLDDLISDYLLDKMDPTAREQFVQRLAVEPDLAARVALEQAVAAALDTSSPENQLRANLRAISERYDSPESLDRGLGEAPGGKTRLWWVLAAGVLILVALAFWKFQPVEKPTISPSQQPSLESPTTPPAENLQKENEPEKNNPLKQQQPIAGAFKPIPKLEAYIGSHMRSGGFRFLVDEPKSGATVSLHAGQLFFRLSGKIEGALPADSSFNLLIFNNNQKDFEALRAVENRTLEIKPGGEFLLQKQLTLKPGLYYLVFEDRQSGEWLFVDKFLVK